VADQAHPGGPAGAEPYLGSRIEKLLAEDPRTSELGIQVRVTGDRVFLRGEVACGDRRARVEEVVREVAPDLDIVDDLAVTDEGMPATGPGEPEVLR
jgi:BON domain